MALEQWWTQLGATPQIETLTIGDELLDGRVADTNTLVLAHRLRQVGFVLRQRTSVPDRIAVITTGLEQIIARGCKLCLVSGGLGPTTDDLTAEALATWQGGTLVRDSQVVSQLEARMAARGKTITANQLRQADRPSGSVLLANPVGTAPGFACFHRGCLFISLPGVPKEFIAMLDLHVLEPLRAMSAGAARAVAHVGCFGLMEAEVDHRLMDFSQKFPQLTLQFRVKFPEIHVTLDGPARQQGTVEQAHQWICQQLQGTVFATSSEQTFAQAVVQALRDRGATVATAESCTGGLASSMLTRIPGSSEVLLGGVVAYHNQIKENILGVPSALLQAHGAVSEPVVQAMAEGAQRLLGARYGIAASGIAGPGGGTAEKPVGTIWLAWAKQGQPTETKLLRLPYGREENQSVATYHLLAKLLHSRT